MIKLDRVRKNPPVHTNFFGQKRVEINLKLLKQKRDGELEKKGEKKWNSAIWKESKKQLLVESEQKCAYCETPTRVVAYGDVEHFRPKSIYWWLAYSYENYLPSCGACNQEYKKDFFELADKTKELKGPRVTKTMEDEELETMAVTLTVDPVVDSEGMLLDDFLNELKSEGALLINPYFDEPSEFLAYKPIIETNEVVVVPTEAKYERVVKACENLFGLNRKELLDLRFEKYFVYMTLRYSLEKNEVSQQTKQMIEDSLRRMRANNSAYAGMIRYFDTKTLDELPWDFGA